MHHTVEQALPFTQAKKDELNSIVNLLTDLYAKCVTHGDTPLAKRQLRLNQREHIAWERDTVWRQMIGHARRGEGEVGGLKALGGSLILEDESGGLNVPTPAGRFKLKLKHLWLLLSTTVFIVLLNVQSVEGDAANRCFAVLMYATLLWATEAIPLFVTSMFVPLLLVVLRTIRSPDGERLSTEDATKYVPNRIAILDHRNNLGHLLLQMGLLPDVLTNNYAPYWWIHHCVGIEQDWNRSSSHHKGS